MMHTTSWVALLSIQYIVSSHAAPPQSFPIAITSQTQFPSLPSQAVNASGSPYYGYFRTVVGDIQAELPPFVTNAAHATKNANATLSFPSITASLPPAATGPILPISDYPLNSPHRTYNYTVPHTLTNLTLHLANPGQIPSIDPSAYAKTLLSLKRTLQAQINSTGDRWLNASEDPYGWDVGLGCWVEFWSNPDKRVDANHGGRKEEQHLTLGILNAVLEGLLQRLVYRGVYEFVYVEVWDSSWGQVGMGFVSPTSGARNETRELSQVLGTLRVEGKR